MKTIKRFPIWKRGRAARWPNVAALVMVLAMQAKGASLESGIKLLTTAQEVHQLTEQEARRGHPVRLRGVVTFYDQEIDELFIQDDTSGIFVLAQGDFGFPIQTGQLLEVEGVSAPGGFAPEIKPARIRLLEAARLPDARLVTIGQMATGREDCRWVELNGTVRAVTPGRIDGLLGLELSEAGERCVALIKDYDLERCQQLVDAEVSVRGVCVAHFNNKRQLLQVGVQISSMADISVKKPAPANPYQAAARPINTVQQFAPDADYGHRVKVEGIVTLQQAGQSLFISDGAQGLHISTKQAAFVHPGDRIEALGFPGTGDHFTPVLQDAVFRKTGTGPPPVPAKITAEEGGKGNYDADLVQLEAQLLDRVERQHDQILELKSGNIIFNAQLDKTPGREDELASVPNNSRVLLTGICLVRADWGNRSPHPFSLMLRSGSDVVLLARPSWWTVEHISWILGTTLGIFSLCLAWVVVLRNRVKAQTEVIGQKIQREAALEERTRIARDIHDDLGADLTHIAFLSEVARKEMEHPQAIEEHLRIISSSARGAVQALDEIVWVVNPKNDTVDNLANYICQFAEGFFRNTPTRCRLDLPSSLPGHPISTEIRNNLFFAVKEALNNISKHARASEVNVQMRMADFLFTIVIEDNGLGVPPANDKPAGDGLLNMRKRLEKIGGHFDLQGQPQGGTQVRLSVDLRKKF